MVDFKITYYIKSSYYVLFYCFIFLPLNCNKETCIEFLESSPKSMYNCYKLLGFDVLVDNNLKVIPELGNLDSVYFEVNEINLHIFPYQWHMKYRSVNIILSEIKVHLMEVNARPQLQDDLLDKAVNRPMVCVFITYTIDSCKVIIIIMICAVFCRTNFH